MHVGHLVPFHFTAYLQRAFKVPVVIQLTDDEKFLYKEGLSLEDCAALVRSNAKDIIACGFDMSSTYIFSNFAAMGRIYPQACAIQRHLTINQVRATFGVTGSDSPGRMAFPAMQMAPAIPSTFAHDLFGGTKLRCLVPCGIDQDPYFRLTRDVAAKMGEHKPAVVQSKFLPALKGTHTKMSSGDASLLLSDDHDTVRQKLSKAFSGGREKLELHLAHGADLERDVALRYLHVLKEIAYPASEGVVGPAMPTRSAKLVERILKLTGGKGSVALDVPAGDLDAVDREYGAGRMLSAEVKTMAADVVSRVLDRHREARARVTDEVVATFMTPRQLV